MLHSFSAPFLDSCLAGCLPTMLCPMLCYVCATPAHTCMFTCRQVADCRHPLLLLHVQSQQEPGLPGVKERVLCLWPDGLDQVSKDLSVCV